MRLTDGRDILTIEPAEFPAGFRGSEVDPDVLLSVAIQLGTYRAADQQWVEAADWCGFVHEFAEMERVRRGQAILCAAVPDDLTLRFYVHDAAGHTAVEGQLMDRGDGPDARQARLTFVMHFEPDQLRPALAEFRAVRLCRP
jgi:hypothetical protein